MKHPIIKFMLIIALVLLMSVASYALNSGAGEIIIILNHNNSPLSDIGLSIVKAADAAESENIITYTLTSEFAATGVNPNNLSTENNIYMSARLSRYVTRNNISVTTLRTDDKGTVSFKNLDPGLYLVMMKSNSRYTMTSVVVPVPIIEEDGYINYIVTAHPKTEPIPEPPTDPTDPSNPDPPNPSDPDGPDEPDNPSDPDNPVEPEVPDEPDDPDDPDEPGEPHEPDNPDVPHEPDNPSDPDNPDSSEPSEPDDPVIESGTITPSTIYVEGIGELTETDVPGVYMIIGEDGVPHYYMYDEELGEWIEVDEFGTPLGSLRSGAGLGSESEAESESEKILPQTGLLRWPVPVLTGSGMILTAAGLVVTIRGKKRDEE